LTLITKQRALQELPPNKTFHRLMTYSSVHFEEHVSGLIETQAYPVQMNRTAERRQRCHENMPVALADEITLG
jgi:hypothetical protein